MPCGLGQWPLLFYVFWRLLLLVCLCQQRAHIFAGKFKRPYSATERVKPLIETAKLIDEMSESPLNKGPYFYCHVSFDKCHVKLHWNDSCHVKCHLPQVSGPIFLLSGRVSRHLTSVRLIRNCSVIWHLSGEMTLFLTAEKWGLIHISVWGHFALKRHRKS